MGAREDTEDVLRKIHVLFSKAVPVENSSRRVIIDKTDMMDLLKELNACMYKMMDEYELTRESRDKAERAQKKHGDDIIFDARKDADDIYAASMMYTERALKSIQESIQTAEDRIDGITRDLKAAMKAEREEVQKNQLDVRGTLQDMVDGEKYIRLIQDENRRLEKEAEEKKEIRASRETAGRPEREAVPAADEPAPVKPEIHINTAYLEKTGMHVPGEEEAADPDLVMEQGLIHEALKDDPVTAQDLNGRTDTGKEKKEKKGFLGGIFGN